MIQTFQLTLNDGRRWNLKHIVKILRPIVTCCQLARRIFYSVNWSAHRPWHSHRSLSSIGSCRFVSTDGLATLYEPRSLAHQHWDVFTDEAGRLSLNLKLESWSKKQANMEYKTSTSMATAMRRWWNVDWCWKRSAFKAISLLNISPCLLVVFYVTRIAFMERTRRMNADMLNQQFWFSTATTKQFFFPWKVRVDTWFELREFVVKL